MEAFIFGFCEMACVSKARINPQFNHAGKLIGMACFKKQTELYPFEKLEQKSNLINLQVSSFIQLKCLSIYDLKRFVVFRVTKTRAPINSISLLFK